MKPRLLLEFLVSSLSSDVGRSPDVAPSFPLESNPENIWRQQLLCIMSSQVKFSTALHATETLIRDIPFFERFPAPREVELTCAKILASPAVRYRFPMMRARQIAQCWFSFLQIHEEFHEFIQSFSSERSARVKIVETFPGFGFKQSSMFMRNIGASQELAVIDVHILYYLRLLRGWGDPILTSRRYLAAEEILQRDADEHGLRLNIFDAVIWNAVRAVKQVVAHA